MRCNKLKNKLKISKLSMRLQITLRRYSPRLNLIYVHGEVQHHIIQLYSKKVYYKKENFELYLKIALLLWLEIRWIFGIQYRNSRRNRKVKIHLKITQSKLPLKSKNNIKNQIFTWHQDTQQTVVQKHLLHSQDWSQKFNSVREPNVISKMMQTYCSTRNMATGMLGGLLWCLRTSSSAQCPKIKKFNNILHIKN